MNKFEQNKKAASTSTIKNSEFDRLNTIHTQDLDPSSQGIHILPPDLEKKKQNRSSFIDSFLKIISSIVSISLFFTIPPLFETILDSSVYDSLIFLFFSILGCVLVGVICYYLFSFYLVHKKKG